MHEKHRILQYENYNRVGSAKCLIPRAANTAKAVWKTNPRLSEGEKADETYKVIKNRVRNRKGSARRIHTKSGPQHGGADAGQRLVAQGKRNRDTFHKKQL